MPSFKSALNRSQSMVFNFDESVPSDSIARVIDSFVDSLDLISLGFKFSTPNQKGNRPYNPADLLKLFLLGYHQGIRSSRKLMYQSHYNIEFIWLLNGLTPDFRTLSDFRKNNIDSLKSVFFQFNLDCKNLGLLSNLSSQDGTKVKAVNSKENNFTLSKIDDRKKRILDHIQEFLQEALLIDQIEDKEELLSSVDHLKTRLASLEDLEKKILDSNSNQISLIDPDSKLMRDNGKFSVSYNNQVLVDVNSHIVQNFQTYDSPADLGSLHSISLETKDIYGFDSLTNITDKGYNDRDDMMTCLENGIIPEVTPLNDSDSFLLETTFEDNNITDEIINSTHPDDIQKCLRAGFIPSIYKNSISSIEIQDSVSYEDLTDNDNTQASDDELRDFSINNYCFTRNINENKVFCPMGEILRKKSKHSNIIRFCNKLACKNCKNPCCSSNFKEVSFRENQKVSYPQNSNIKRKRSKNRKKIITKKVVITLNVHRDLLKLRMATSEHPHASMKFWDNSRYMLLKGKRKVTGELALYYCAYNIRRARNLLNSSTLTLYFNQKKKNRTSVLDSILLFFRKYHIFVYYLLKF